jgi:hypothetical protein
VSSLEEFQIAAEIQSATVARSVVDFFVSAGVGRHSGFDISFSPGDRMKAAMICLERGCDLRELSGRISWKDFEQLASESLRSFGYKTKTNVRFIRPRMEIDVVGILSRLAIAVDCKHWRHTNRSSILESSRKQAARASRLVEGESRIRQVVPVILTLNSESVKFADGIPIVPIVQFRLFLQDLDAFLPEIRVISRF